MDCGFECVKEEIEMNKEEYEETRKRKLKQISDLENIIHVLEATASFYYTCMEKKNVPMWNALLEARDELNPKIEKEQTRLYKEIEKLDGEILKRD